MKILHFHPNGRMADRFVGPLMLEEVRQGYETRLVVSSQVEGAIFKKIPYDLNLTNLILLIPSFIRIIIVMLAYKPDVVFSHNSKSAFLPLFSAWLIGVRERVYFNHGVPYVGYTGFIRKFLRFLEYLNCSFSNEIVTVSEDMVRLISDVVPDAKPHLIHNGSACGIDLAEYSNDSIRRSFWRTANGFKKDDIIVVYIGRPVVRKGFVQALRVWERGRLSSRFKLILCGPEEKDVVAKFKKIPDNVSCLGFVDNVSEILADADVLILPSLHEGLSYAVLEAMASGCLVIANDIPGVRCIVKNELNGFLVEKNNIEEYERIIHAFERGELSMNTILEYAKKTANMYERSEFITKYRGFIGRFI